MKRKIKTCSGCRSRRDAASHVVKAAKGKKRKKKKMDPREGQDSSTIT